MVLKLHKKRIWIALLFVFFWMQQVLLEHTSGMAKKIIGYSDEVLACILIAMIIYSIFRFQIRLLKTEYILLLCYIGFAIFGLISTFIDPMQGWFLALSDMLVCSRFVIFYFAVRILLGGNFESDMMIIDISSVCRVFTIITTLIALHDIFLTPFFPKYDFRYFMYSLRLFFPHPTYMAVGCVTAATVLMAANGTEEKKSTQIFNTVCVFLLCLLTALTLRSKAIAAAACIVMFYFLLVRFNLKSKVILFGGGGALALIIGWEQIMYYFSTGAEVYVRARLQIDSVMLANRSFPFGTGFGTFGSAIAAENYSPLYQELGYSLLHGGSSDDTRFLCDTFWSTVIAQTGWIGAVLFLIVVICFVIIVFRVQKVNKYYFWAALSIIVYELLSSVSEAAFFNPSTCVLFAVLAFIVNSAEKERFLKEDVL